MHAVIEEKGAIMWQKEPYPMDDWGYECDKCNKVIREGTLVRDELIWNNHNEDWDTNQIVHERCYKRMEEEK